MEVHSWLGNAALVYPRTQQVHSFDSCPAGLMADAEEMQNYYSLAAPCTSK